jgi:hypothetical protein
VLAEMTTALALTRNQWPSDPQKHWVVATRGSSPKCGELHFRRILQHFWATGHARNVTAAGAAVAMKRTPVKLTPVRTQALQAWSVRLSSSRSLLSS